MLFVLCASTASYAEKDEVFLSHVSKLIFEDCRGHDITVRQGYDQTGRSGILPWPYDEGDVLDLSQMVVEAEPYDSFQSGGGVAMVFPSGNPGVRRIECDGHSLDISKHEWFWDERRVERPTKVTNVNVTNQGPNSRNVATFGDNSPATAGDHSPAGRTNIIVPVTVSFGAGVGITLIICGIRRKRRDRDSGDTLS